MSIDEIKKKLSEHKEELQKKYKIREIGLFGSFVKNEQNTKSDIDILVKFEVTPTLLKFISLENCLSDLLGIKVDLVMKRALKPTIGKTILEEVIFI